MQIVNAKIGRSLSSKIVLNTIIVSVWHHKSYKNSRPWLMLMFKYDHIIMLWNFWWLLHLYSIYDSFCKHFKSMVYRDWCKKNRNRNWEFLWHLCTHHGFFFSFFTFGFVWLIIFCESWQNDFVFLKSNSIQCFNTKVSIYPDK